MADESNDGPAVDLGYRSTYVEPNTVPSPNGAGVGDGHRAPSVLATVAIVIAVLVFAAIVIGAVLGFIPGTSLVLP